MAAEDHLSPRLFHGTNVKLQPGDMLHPNRGEGFNKEHPEHSDFVWMSNRLHDAHWYADMRSEGTSKGHVYEVDPQGLHGPADTLTSGKKSTTTHISLAPARVIREVPHAEREAAAYTKRRR